jgi:hypothetical protein
VGGGGLAVVSSFSFSSSTSSSSNEWDDLGRLNRPDVMGAKELRLLGVPTLVFNNDDTLSSTAVQTGPEGKDTATGSASPTTKATRNVYAWEGCNCVTLAQSASRFSSR